MKTTDFIAPIEGMLLPVESVEDETFSERIMGDGFAIDILGNDVVAPIDGEISVAFPTGHAVCITGDDGVQVMIHIGLETHLLEKNPHRLFVKKGDRVNKGDLLVKTDYKLIQKMAKSSKCPIIFLNGEKVEMLKLNQRIKLKEPNIVEVTIGETE